MGPEVLGEWLSAAWQLGVGAFFGYLIVNQFWKTIAEHFRISILRGVVSTIMIVSCAAWALAFLNVTYMENESLKLVFADYEKPALNFLHVLLAIMFGILFAVLVSNGWRLAVVIPLGLGLAAADFAGNSALIAGIEQMRAGADAAGAPFGPPQLAWYDYYVAEPHLERIIAYAVVMTISAGLGLSAFLIWWRTPPDARGALEGSSRYWGFRYAAGLCFCLAIIGNEAAVWSWRLDRECRLAAYQLSLFYGDAEQCAGG